MRSAEVIQAYLRAAMAPGKTSVERMPPLMALAVELLLDIREGQLVNLKKTHGVGLTDEERDRRAAAVKRAFEGLPS